MDQLNSLLAPTVAGLTGLATGWLVASLNRPVRRQLERERALRAREREEIDRALATCRREMTELRERVDEHTHVFLFLPDLIRQIFSASGLRTIGPLALNLVDQLFRPERAAVFVSRASQKKLALAAGLRLPEELKPGQAVDFGQGRLGYVAEHKVAMDEDDFRSAPGERTGTTLDVRRRLDTSGLAGFRAEVVAPILDERELLGVIAIAGARARVDDAKKLLTMVADITAAALIHATCVRASEESDLLDGLTGVYNKRHLLERLAEELKRAEKGETPLSLLILDLDHFRQYNRANGSLQGDEVLKQLATLLRTSVRESDVVGRFGGEEFVVIYPGAGKELVMRLAESLRCAIEAYPFPNRGQQPLGAVTVSGGVAAFPEDSRKADNLLRCADHALYEAKAEGRNRIFPAEPNFLA